MIYCRVIGLQASSWEIDINHIINHVFALVPTAVFTETGWLSVGKKQNGADESIKVEASKRPI